MVSLVWWWMWNAAAFEKLPWYLSNRYSRFTFHKEFQQTGSCLSYVHTFVHSWECGIYKNDNCFTHVNSQRSATSLSPRKLFPPVDTLWDLISVYGSCVQDNWRFEKFTAAEMPSPGTDKLCENYSSREKVLPWGCWRQKRQRIQFSSAFNIFLRSSYFQLILRRSS